MGGRTAENREATFDGYSIGSVLSRWFSRAKSMTSSRGHHVATFMFFSEKIAVGNQDKMVGGHPVGPIFCRCNFLVTKLRPFYRGNGVVAFFGGWNESR